MDPSGIAYATDATARQLIGAGWPVAGDGYQGKAARAAGLKVRSGKLPNALMLSTKVLEPWQRDDLEEVKAAVEADMQRRKHREAVRGPLEKDDS